MRKIVLALGALLLAAGGVLVVVADDHRQDAVAQLRQQLGDAQERLDETRGDNLRRAEQLTRLRSAVAALEDALASSAGFLE